MDFGDRRYKETRRTETIEAALEAVRTRLTAIRSQAKECAVAPGLTVRQTADGVEHFILEVSRGGAVREVDVSVDTAGGLATSIVRTRKVAGKRVRDVAKRRAVPDVARLAADDEIDALVADVESELPEAQRG